MLTPEEQAFDLVLLFEDKFNGIRKDLAKKQALIAARIIKRELVEALDNEVSGIYAIYWSKVEDEIKLIP